MPYAGKLVKVAGWATNVTSSATTSVALAIIRHADNSSSAITPTALIEQTWTSDSGSSVNECTLASTSPTSSNTFNSGDRLITMVKSSGTGSVYAHLAAHIHFNV